MITRGKAVQNKGDISVKEKKGLPAPPIVVLEAAVGDRPWAVDLRTRSGPEGSSRSKIVSGRVSGLPHNQMILCEQGPFGQKRRLLALSRELRAAGGAFHL